MGAISILSGPSPAARDVAPAGERPRRQADSSESDAATSCTNKDDDITSRVYDELMPMFSDDGKFSPGALATLAKSYVELQLLAVGAGSGETSHRSIPAGEMTHSRHLPAGSTA